MINKKELALAVAKAANLIADNITDYLLVKELSIFIQEASIHVGSPTELDETSLRYTASTMIIKAANGGKPIFTVDLDPVVEWTPSVKLPHFERIGLCELRATR